MTREHATARLMMVAAALAAALAGCVPGEPVQRPEPAPLPEPRREKARIHPGEPPQAPLPPSAAPPTGPGNPPFYEVFGERYYVLPESEGYTEQGVASWYGREFHGRRTSSGEVYDMYAMTAAHKTLPLPTLARVTNLATGKSITVRINDRGPFKKSRLIDLSYAAARELGFVADGTALVEVEAIGPAAGPARAAAKPRPPAPPPLMYVQVGAFSQQQNALELQRRLERQGFSSVTIRYDARTQPALYRVRVGPVRDAGEFDAVVARVDELDVGTPRLVVEAAVAQ